MSTHKPKKIVQLTWRRPLYTAFMAYVKAERRQLMVLMSLSPGEAGDKLGHKWHTLSKGHQEYYQREADSLNRMPYMQARNATVARI